MNIAINPTASVLKTASGVTVPAYSYVVAVTPLGAAQQVISGTLPSDYYLLKSDPTWLTPNTEVPKDMSFGWAASTGATNDIHEVRDVQIRPLTTMGGRFGLALSDSAAGVLVKTASVTYTAHPSVSSSGGTQSAAPRLITTFPTGITPKTASGTNWTCTISGQTVTCTYTGSLPIAAGTSLPTVAITATVTSTATSGAKSVTAVLTGQGGLAASATDTGTVTTKKTTPVLGLTLTNSASGSLQQKASVTYVATGVVSSNGAAEADAPDFVDTFPVGLTPGTATGTDWSCTTTPATRKVTCKWTGGSIAAGTTLPAISIPVTVGTVTGGLTDIGTLSSANATPKSVSATDYGEVVSLPALKVALTDNKTGDFTAGGTVTYAVKASVSTSGGSEADDPVITDTFPADFSAVTSSGTDWTCVQSGTKTTGFTETCTWTGAVHAAGSSYTTLTFKATVSTGLAAKTVIDDSVSVASDDAAGSTATDYALVGSAPAPDLEISASAPRTAPENSAYSLKVTTALGATGGKATDDPSVALTLPVDEKFTAKPAPATWTCSALTTTTRKTTCKYKGTLPVDPGKSMAQIAASVEGTAPGDYTALALISDTTNTATSASSVVTVQVTADPVLALTAAATPTALSAGSSYTLTLSPSIKATGGATHHAPVLKATLPTGKGETFAATPTPADFTCVRSNTTKTLTCTEKTAVIAAGSSLGTVVATVDTTVAGTPLTTTAALSDATDHATTVTATAKVDVTAVPKFALTAAATPTALSAGSSYTVTLTPSTKATGGPTHHAPVLKATLPAGETFAAAPTPADFTCVLSNTTKTLTCTEKTAAIAAGSSLGTVVATVDTTVAGTPLTTTAALSDATDHATTVTATAKVDVTAVPKFALTAAATPTALSAGSSYTVTLTPSTKATGGPTHHAPVLKATLPAGETFAAAPTPADFTCVLSNTTKTLTCTEKTAAIAAGSSLGTVVATVDTTVAGTPLTTTAALSDATDHATTVTATAKVDVTAVPKFALTAAATPTALSAGSSYTVTLTPSTKATGGPTHHAPVLKATLPAGETFAATPTPADFTCVLSNTTKTLTCTEKTAAIAAGSSLGTVVATVDTTVAGTPLTTTAALSDATDHATTVTATAKVDVTAVPKFALTAAATPTALSAGSSYTVTLTPSTKATGGPTHHAPVLKATLPAGETFAAAPTPADFTCVLSNTTKTLTCTEKTAAIAAGSSLGTVVATVDTTVAGTPLTTTAALSDATDHATTVTATAKVDVTAVPKFALTAAATPTALSAGSSYTVTLTPSTKATGGPTHHAPVLKATLPAGETFAAAPTPADFTCVLSNTTKTLTCTEKTAAIAAGSSLGTVVATVDTTVAGTPLTTTAALSDATDHATTVTATAKVDVTAVPVLGLTAAATPTQAEVGTSYTLILTPSVTGSAYHHSKLTDTLPTGETFAAPLPTITGWTCALSSGTKTLTCTSTTDSGLKPVKVVVDVAATAATGVHTDSATLSDATDGASPVTKTSTVTVTSVPVLGLSTSGTPAQAEVGTSYTLTLTPSVTGTAYHHSKLIVTLPSGETFAPLSTITGWSCGLSDGTAILTCTSTTDSGLKPVTVTVDVSPSALTGAHTTTATLSDATDSATPVTKTAAVTVTNVPVLGLTTSGTPAQAEVGTSYTLTLTPSVTGTAYHHSKLIVTLPTGETFAPLPTITGWSCGLSGGTATLTCTSTTDSGLKTVTVTVEISPSALAGVDTTTATLSDATDGATPVSKTASVTVTSVPVLGLTSSGTPAQAEVGTSYTLTLTPTVTGTAYHHSKLTATLPTGETFAPLPTITGWSCGLSGGTETITCTSTTDSGLKPVTVTVDVSPSAETGAHTTTATLSDATDSATPVTKTASVTVTNVPVLGLSTSGTPAQAEVGTSYTLTLTPTVTGTAYHRSKLIVTLPTGETFAPLSTITGWSCALSDGTATLTCTSATDSGLKTVTVTVDVGATAATGINTTTATLSDATDSATPVTKTASVTVTAVPELGLSTSGTPALAEVGTSYTLTLTPSVTGTAYHHSTLIVTLPTGETFAPLPTITGWSCGLSGGTATLTCTSTTDSGLKTVTVTVEISPSALAGVDTTTATLSDATDGATPVSKTASVTVTNGPGARPQQLRHPGPGRGGHQLHTHTDPDGDRHRLPPLRADGDPADRRDLRPAPDHHRVELRAVRRHSDPHLHLHDRLGPEGCDGHRGRGGDSGDGGSHHHGHPLGRHRRRHPGDQDSVGDSDGRPGARSHHLGHPGPGRGGHQLHTHTDADGDWHRLSPLHADRHPADGGDLRPAGDHHRMELRALRWHKDPHLHLDDRLGLEARKGHGERGGHSGDRGPHHHGHPLGCHRQCHRGDQDSHGHSDQCPNARPWDFGHPGPGRGGHQLHTHTDPVSHRHRLPPLDLDGDPAGR